MSLIDHYREIPRPALESEAAPLTSKERWIAVAGLLVLLALKIVFAFHRQIDSDEPQHLHTVWAWATGQLPYVNVFDNHMPLFQWLCSPLFRAFGERADIVRMMRLAMIPLYFGVLWCVFRITSILHSAQAGLWAMLFTGFCPKFFFVSTEFRTDDLWTSVWMVALLVALGGRFAGRRALIFGFLVGIAFAISMKTTLLLGTLALAGGAVLFLRWSRSGVTDWPALAKSIGLALVAGLIPPTAVAIYFAAHGAWSEFVYCVFQHNVVPGVIETNGIPVAGRPYYFPVAAPILLFLAWRLLRKGRDYETMGLLSLATGFYLTALWSYWPILSDEDYEPFYPMLFIVLIPFAFELCRKIARWQATRAWQVGVFAAIAIFFQMWLVFTQHLFTDATVEDVRMVADVLKLTTPDQYVMDGKGETVFRRRPFYYAMETMTDARFARGVIKDDIAERIIKTQAPVARLDRLPHAGHRFVAANYLKVTRRLLVLGKDLAAAPAESGLLAGSRKFEIAVPARYTVLDNKGKPLPGKLDGESCTGGKWLEAGVHTFIPESPCDGLRVLWADAFEKGYRPL